MATRWLTTIMCEGSWLFGLLCHGLFRRAFLKAFPVAAQAMRLERTVIDEEGADEDIAAGDRP